MQNAALKPPAAARSKPATPPDEGQTSQNLGAQQSSLTAPPRTGTMPPAPAAETALGAIGRMDTVQGDLPPVQPYTPEPTQRLTQAEPPRAESADPTLRIPDGWMFVLDTSAHEVERWHEQIVNGTIKKFRFLPRQPTALSPDIAVKFLKSEGFMLTDANGTPKEWAQTPRQPHEMGAGEQISLGPNEVIAALDELTRGSLIKRALQLGANEGAMEASKDDLIAFVRQKTLEYRRQKRNGGKGVAQESAEGLDLEEFVPSADMLPDTAADRLVF